MARHCLKITEEQYKRALSEEISVAANLTAANNDPTKAYQQARTDAQRSGLDLKKVNIVMPATNESINSRVYTISEFMHQIGRR